MKVSMFRGLAAGVIALAIVHVPLRAQDRLKSMPGYDQYQKMSREIPGSVKLGSINAQWKDDSTSFEYTFDGKRYRYDVATKQASVVEAAAGAAAPSGGRGRG